jgi:hypothetical protein
VTGVWFVGIFVATVFSYICTEYLFAHLDARRRVVVGEGFTLLVILGANLASFVVMLACGLVVVVASGHHFYLEATVICLSAQIIWLTQNLWFYHRDHLRVNFGKRLPN